MEIEEYKKEDKVEVLYNGIWIEGIVLELVDHFATEYINGKWIITNKWKSAKVKLSKIDSRTNERKVDLIFNKEKIRLIK